MSILKDNKGFTLTELLAVLVILITIFIVVIPSISSVIERNKYKAISKSEKIIEDASVIFIDMYKGRLRECYNEFKTGNKQVEINNLITVDLLEQDFINEYLDNLVEYEDKYYSLSDLCFNNEFEIVTCNSVCTFYNES